MDERTPHRKIRVGTVVSNKMEKTIVVRVTRHDRHPLYGKKIIKAKSYVAHDENNVSSIGDTVSIGETSPMSRTKRWELLEIVRKAPVFDGVVEDSAEA